MKPEKRRGRATPPKSDQAKTPQPNNNKSALDSAKGSGPSGTRNQPSGKKGKPPPSGNDATGVDFMPLFVDDQYPWHVDDDRPCFVIDTPTVTP